MQADIYQVEHVKNIKFSKNKMKSKMEIPNKMILSQYIVY